MLVLDKLKSNKSKVEQLERSKLDKKKTQKEGKAQKTNFEEAYEAFIQRHTDKGSKSRLLQLKEGHGHAEKLFLLKVWWPAFGNFDNLYPEYEVVDFKDGKRYLDFAYIRAFIKIVFEIDGYGPHWQNMSRRKFADDRMRQNHLVIDGWIVIRFAYDDVAENPRQCQQVLQQLMGRWMDSRFSGLELDHVEKEIIRIGIRTDGIMKFKDIRSHLGVSEKTTRKILKGMIDKNVLRPASGKHRIHSYELIPGKIDRLF